MNQRPKRRKRQKQYNYRAENGWGNGLRVRIEAEKTIKTTVNSPGKRWRPLKPRQWEERERDGQIFHIFWRNRRLANSLNLENKQKEVTKKILPVFGLINSDSNY